MAGGSYALLAVGYTLVYGVLGFDYGQTIAAGPPDVVGRDARVLDAYLGSGGSA